jgi:hypothetical protein
VAGGAILGAVAGSMIDRGLSERTGLEYVLRADDGDIKTITQEKAEGDVIFKKGDRVMMQACDAGDNYKRCASGKDYQRLLPTDIPAPVAPVHAHKHRKNKSVDVSAEPEPAAGDDGR